VIILDSFAVLALLGDEPAAGVVQQLVESDEVAALTALGVSEVLDLIAGTAPAARPPDQVVRSVH